MCKCKGLLEVATGGVLHLQACMLCPAAVNEPALHRVVKAYAIISRLYVISCSHCCKGG